MESLRGSSISEIEAVPGLFISDRFAAGSIGLLKSLNIKYVLSVTRAADVPKFKELYETAVETFLEEEKVVTKHIDVDDAPTEDLLYHLTDACDWIDVGLHSCAKDHEKPDSRQVGVLVHCVQGISRSGSIIVAYLMRTLSLPYSSALEMARQYRPRITPSSGFEKQLRIWETCRYDIFLKDTVPSDGSKPKQTKGAYKIWKKERDEIVSQGPEAVNWSRFQSMGRSAADFGRRRAEAIAKRSQEGEENRVGKGAEDRRWEGSENARKIEE